MESILISIRPEWCELIIAGKKTLEIRKTMPNLETPFKCYIYETKGIYMPQLIDSRFKCQGVGKVIGEFICDNIECFGVPYPAFQSELDKRILEESCLTYYQLHRYAYHDALYGWHISQLKVYDEPKEFGHFIKPGYEEMETLEDTLCNYCSQTEYGTHKSGTSPISGVWFCEGRWCESSYKKYLEKEFSLKRPPQSWCYVEEVV